MASTTEALNEVAAPIKLYLTEVASLAHSTADERGFRDLTAQNRLATAEAAVNHVRQKYELAIPDSEVLKFGVRQLTNVLPVFAGSRDPNDRLLEHTVATAIELVLRSPTNVTLRGLLAETRANLPLNPYN